MILKINLDILVNEVDLVAPVDINQFYINLLLLFL
jgi:hypothetical protein